MQDSHSVDEAPAAWNAEQLSAAQSVLKQLPWELVSDLTHQTITADICTPILHFLGGLAQVHAVPGAQAKDLAQTLVKVRWHLHAYNQQVQLTREP